MPFVAWRGLSIHASSVRWVGGVPGTGSSNPPLLHHVKFSDLSAEFRSSGFQPSFNQDPPFPFCLISDKSSSASSFVRNAHTHTPALSIQVCLAATTLASLSSPREPVHITILTSICPCFTVLCTSDDPCPCLEVPTTMLVWTCWEYSLNVLDLGSQMDLVGIRDIPINGAAPFEI